MIEGFKLKLSHTELRDHCRDRAKYHRGRAEQKTADLPALREAVDKIRESSGSSPATLAHMNKTSNYAFNSDDPVKDLEADIRDHGNKALVFDFFAAHLFPEDYTLEENDLVRLEILKR